MLIVDIFSLIAELSLIFGTILKLGVRLDKSRFDQPPDIIIIHRLLRLSFILL
jgi:hypothetical protein